MRTLVILPTTITERERTLAAARAGRIFGHEAVSRTAFVRLAHQALHPDQIWLNEGEGLAVLAGWVSDYYAAHPTAPFAALRHRVGFLKSLHRFLNECRMACFEKGETATALRAGGINDGRAALLSDLYEGYQKCLVDLNGVTAAGAEADLSKDLETSFDRIPILSDADEIQIRGIYDIKPASFEWILGLARRRPTTLFLPLPKDHPRSILWLEWTYRKFEYLGETEPAGLTVQPEELHAQSALSDLLPHLFQPLAAIREMNVPPLSAKLPLRILEASNPRAEIMEIARWARTRCEEGAELGRIAVLFRRPEVYPNALDTFIAFGIPVEVSPALQSVWAPDLLRRETLDIAALAAKGFGREDILGWMGRSCCELPDILQDPDIGRILREARVMRGNPAALEKKLKRLGAGVKDLIRKRKIHEIAAALKKVLTGLDSLSRPSTPSRYFRHLQTALTTVGLYKQGRTEEANPLHEKLSRLTKIAERWDQELEPHILFDILEACLLEAPAAAAGGVRLLSVEDLPGVEVDHLFIAGMTAGVFPQEPKQEVFLKDHERLAVSSAYAEHNKNKFGHRLAGHRPFDTAKEERLRENFLFFLCMAQPAKSVTLSHPKIDTQGRPTTPSPYLDEIFKQFKDPAELIHSETSSIRTADERDTEAVIALDAGAKRVFVSDPVRLRQMIESIDIERRREQFYLERNRETRASLAFEYTGRLSGRGPFWTREEMPVRSLDSFAGCPFKGFSGEIIGVRDTDKPTDGLSAMDLGSLLHKFLEIFWKELKQRHDPAPKDVETFMADARSLVPKAMAEAAREIEQRAADDPLWTSQKSALKYLIESILAMEEQSLRNGYWPKYIEQSISFSLNLPRNMLPRRLNGRIDRMDQGPDGCLRIVDYKLSDISTLRQKKQKLGRTEMQLPAYANADAIRHLPEQTHIVLQYISLRHSAQALSVWTGPKSETAALLEKRLSGILDAVASGRFDVTPEDETLCGRCELRRACRIQEVLSSETAGEEIV